MKVTTLLIGAIVAGITGAYGVNVGADLAQDNIFHTEVFEVVVYEDYSIYGEPVDARYGFEIEGEGVAVDNEIAKEFILESGARTGDIVAVSWTENQAEHSDWATPAKIELKEDKTP